MFAVCVPVWIFLSSMKVPLWIILLLICMGKLNADGTDSVVGKVGNPVFLHPSKLQGNVDEVKWKKNRKIVGKLINENLQCESRYKIFPNGSLRMSSTNKNDAGIYTLEVFDKNGKNIMTKIIELRMQDDVTMPVVHMSCTVDGRVKLICSVQQEDEVTFHWTVHTVLSNYTLDDAVAKHHILYLWGQTPGDLVCVASNALGQKSSLPVSMTCRAHISSLMALGLFLALPTLAIAIMTLKKKRIHVLSKDADECYVVMHKKSDSPPDNDVSYYDADECYVVMHKKSDSPPDNDVSYYVICSTRLNGDRNENMAELELEDVYI